MGTIKNKFTKSLEMSHKEIKGKRAAMFATDAELDSSNYLRNLETKKRTLDRTLMNLEDFHADSTTTLKVTKDGFDSKSWIGQMNETTVAIALLEAKITIAKTIHATYFL
jgi:hypothetical protein